MMLTDMAENFNPRVQTLRLHWFAARPCFDLLDPAGRTDFANEFLSEDRYYGADLVRPRFHLRRLGRRFQQLRDVGKNRYTPHGFWGLYMANVAHPNYRGAWKGFAPMRFVFYEKSGPYLRVTQEISKSLSPEIQHIRAYPNCYLTPIGWTVGIVIQMEGDIPLAACPDVVERLRKEQPFVWRGNDGVSLKTVLRDMHEMISEELIRPRVTRTLEQDPQPYMVVTPLRFEGQASFCGKTVLDAEGITKMLAGGPLQEGKSLLVKPDSYSLAMTALNRGTFLMSDRPDSEPHVPGCASSNLKNALLITTLMQKFHHLSRGHRNPLVTAMRSVVAETFAQLENFWSKPNFRQICDAHTGILKLREAGLDSTQATIIYRFDYATLTNVAIGTQARFIQSTQPNNGQGEVTSDLRGGADMSSFNFNAEVKNAAIGDHAVFNQNIQSLTVEQLSAGLEKVRDIVNAKASSEVEKADAQKISAAADEAKKGNKDAAVGYLDQVGGWGLGNLQGQWSSGSRIG